MMPFATTTVTIARPDGATEPYEDPALTTVATSVRANVTAPSGSDRHIGGVQEIVAAVAYLDAGVDIVNNDRVTDAFDGSSYRVVWTSERTGLGLGHIKAGLVRVTGAASG